MKPRLQSQSSGRSALIRSIFVLAVIVFYVSPAAAWWDDTIVNCGAKIVAVGSPGRAMCLDVDRVSDRAPAKLRACDDVNTDLWRVRLANDGGIFLEVAAEGGDGRILEIADFSKNNGAAVQIWGLNIPSHRGSQQWNIIPRGEPGGEFAIANENSKKCIDVPSGNYTAGTALQQWECHAEHNQQWAFRTESHYWLGRCPTKGPRLP